MNEQNEDDHKIEVWLEQMNCTFIDFKNKFVGGSMIAKDFKKVSQ